MMESTLLTLTLLAALGVAQNVTVTPTILKLAETKSAKVTCKVKAGLNFTVKWLTPDLETVNELNDTRLKDNGNGVLELTKAVLNDTGKWFCVAPAPHGNATCDVTVYVMPSYFTEALIILCINGGLVILFFLCLIHSQLTQHRRKRLYKRTRELED